MPIALVTTLMNHELDHIYSVIGSKHLKVNQFVIEVMLNDITVMQPAKSRMWGTLLDSPFLQ